MNIVIVNDFAYVDGGASQAAITTAVGLAKRGHNIIMFTAIGPALEYLRSIPNLTLICLEQADIVSDPNRLRAIMNGLWNEKVARIFSCILRNLDKSNTVIHVHSISKFFSTSIIRMAINMNFRVLFHLHDYGIACPNSAFYNFSRHAICKLQPLSLDCIRSNCDSRKYAHKIWRCMRQIIQLKMGGLPSEVSDFIVVSEFSQRILHPFLPSKANAHLVHYPIDEILSTPAQPEKNEQYLFVGRFAKDKDPVIVAKVLNSLGKKAVFVGSGEQDSQIRQRCPSAVITGWLDRKGVREEIRKSRALIFPSRWYETQGLVVPEAAANGIPAIVSKTSAAAEYILDEVTGLTFEAGNDLALSIKINLLDNDDLVKKMGQNAYNHFWASPLTKERYLQKIERVYETIICQGVGS